MNDENNDSTNIHLIDKVEQLATKVGMLERENQDLKFQIQRLTLAREKLT